LIGRQAFHFHRLADARQIARDERDRHVGLGRDARYARWTLKSNDCD
jgi:hypothetical protein